MIYRCCSAFAARFLGFILKKVLIPVLALILLLSGGVGAYFFMGGESVASTGETAKVEEKAEGEEGGKIAYVPMQPIILPIIDQDGISQTVSLVVSLEVRDAAKVAEVEQNLPVLADAFLSDMYGTLSKKSSMEGGVIKVSQLKARLVEITKRVMGEGAVNGVLLQVLQQHPT
ncbi:MAG: flagellar basal body-associated FliL family protein [Proteobacteria bacterium]|nr:flagellar basal body-associated FliL family protein [Pseudomonadota bacterium]